MRRRVFDEAVAALSEGGLIAYPTEGVWGLGCDPANPDAVLRLLAAKRRPLEKGLILIASRFEHLQPWVAMPSRSAVKRAMESWPGPNTWLFPAHEDTPPWITGGNPGVAIRVTAHPVAARLCAAWGAALVSTSANRSGEPTAPGPSAVRRRFARELDVLVPGALGGLGRPSTIRDVRSGHIVRQ